MAVHYATLVACVLGIAYAQFLFKLCGFRVKDAGLGGLWDFAPFYGVVTIYVVVTIAWIWAIQDIPLSRAYALMAITFVAVPLISRFFLGEALSPMFWVGTALIFAGTLLVVQT